MKLASSLIYAAGLLALGFALGIYAGQATCAKPQVERTIAKPHVMT